MELRVEVTDNLVLGNWYKNREGQGTQKNQRKFKVQIQQLMDKWHFIKFYSVKFVAINPLQDPQISAQTCKTFNYFGFGCEFYLDATSLYMNLP